jgi:DNA-binding transcriptional regulator YdaS (Cro superfamily)
LTDQTGIDKAVRSAGGAASLAAKLGVSHQAVYQWIQNGWVPSERALELERIYHIPRAELLSPKLAALMPPAPHPAQDLI